MRTPAGPLHAWRWEAPSQWHGLERSGAVCEVPSIQARGAVPFQGGRETGLCIAVCRTSTPAARAGRGLLFVDAALIANGRPARHPPLPPIKRCWLPARHVKMRPAAPEPLSVLRKHQSHPAALKLAAGALQPSHTGAPQHGVAHLPPGPRSSVQLRGIRVSQVRLLLQKVHPALEELAAPAPVSLGLCMQGARLPSDRLRVSDHAEVPLRASHGHCECQCNCFSLPRSSSSGTRREPYH